MLISNKHIYLLTYLFRWHVPECVWPVATAATTTNYLQRPTRVRDTTTDTTATTTARVVDNSFITQRMYLHFALLLLFNHLTPTVAICPERQSARMSKITNDGLTRSGTGCFIAVPLWQQWASNG